MRIDPKNQNKGSMQGIFGGAAFDIEHALNMYALGYCTLPAEGIYEKELIESFGEAINDFHIYLIGYTPIVKLLKAQQKVDRLLLIYEVLNKQYAVPFKLPEHLNLINNEEEAPYLTDASGKKYWPNDIAIQSQLNSISGAIDFEVKYIGQAYGQDGSRHAIDRLLEHETLQKIALKPIPNGHRISLLLLSIQSANRLFTVMNPFANDTKSGAARIRQGLDKLFNTTEAERISLYEASLIRYFYPEFNKEFKDSFPSTNLKILQDCYEKDFSAVVAEISIDELPFYLYSSSVKRSLAHIARHDLHKSSDRKIFFDL